MDLNIKIVKNEVAREKGYLSWSVMENFIIDHNTPVNVAILLVSAMEDVCERIMKDKKDFEILR